MFTDVKLMFLVRKHKFTAQKHKFSAQKHKLHFGIISFSRLFQLKCRRTTFFGVNI